MFSLRAAPDDQVQLSMLLKAERRFAAPRGTAVAHRTDLFFLPADPAQQGPGARRSDHSVVPDTPLPASKSQASSPEDKTRPGYPGKSQPVQQAASQPVQPRALHSSLCSIPRFSQPGGAKVAASPGGEALLKRPLSGEKDAIRGLLPARDDGMRGSLSQPTSEEAILCCQPPGTQGPTTGFRISPSPGGGPLPRSQHSTPSADAAARAQPLPPDAQSLQQAAAYSAATSIQLKPETDAADAPTARLLHGCSGAHQASSGTQRAYSRIGAQQGIAQPGAAGSAEIQAGREFSGCGVNATAHHYASTATVTAPHQPGHLPSRQEAAHGRSSWEGAPYAGSWMPAAAQKGGLRQQWQNARVIQKSSSTGRDLGANAAVKQQSSTGRDLEAKAAIKQVRLDGRAGSLLETNEQVEATQFLGYLQKQKALWHLGA